MDIERLRSEYESKEKVFKELAETAQFFIMQDIHRKKIKIHSIPYRIKKFDSFVDKIRRKNVNDPFNEIMDIVGLRIVCLFLSNVKEIGLIVKNKFEIIEEDDQINSIDENIFGYMTLKYKAKLGDIIIDDKKKEIVGMPFEIQIRTISQDAWASISHHLDYKKVSDIPQQLRKDFYALSGLFYVADTHFEILRKEESELLIQQLRGDIGGIPS